MEHLKPSPDPGLRTESLDSFATGAVPIFHMGKKQFQPTGLLEQNVPRGAATRRM